MTRLIRSAPARAHTHTHTPQWHTHILLASDGPSAWQLCLVLVVLFVFMAPPVLCVYYAASFGACHVDSQRIFCRFLFLRCTSCNAGTAVEIYSVHAHRLGRKQKRGGRKGGVENGVRYFVVSQCSSRARPGGVYKKRTTCTPQ